MHAENGAAAIEAAIDGAEEIRDPLDGLVERTRLNPGAPFEPETLERLKELRKEDPAAFEILRSELSKTECRIAEFDKALADERPEGEAKRESQAKILIRLASSAKLFHTSDDTGFADITINGHRQTWPIRSKGFKHWLLKSFLDETGGAPGSEALNAAMNAIEARARFDGEERPVYVRVGGLDGKYYVDLCDAKWRALEIDASGWRVIENPPVRFRRTAGMKPLPEPIPGGSIEELRSFLNVQSEDEFVLAVAWLLACLRNRGPYPALVLSGEQGSAKSTFTAILRALIDPNTAPLRSLPREDRDLFIAAKNGHLLAFDNVSSLPPWMSDTLCRLATGGGFSVRQLYTDMDEVLFDAARPIMLNGIEDFVTRHDLADRALLLTLSPIPEECRRPEAELWTAFEAAHPRILGVLLDAVVTGLRELPSIRLERHPRMADFARWGAACETAFWPAGTFMLAYGRNRDEVVANLVEADPVAVAVRQLMARQETWRGTASELLDELGKFAGERNSKVNGWPQTPQGLSGRLKRAAESLRKCGIQIDKRREGRERDRMIYIEKVSQSSPENRATGSSAPSVSFAATPNLSPANDFADIRPRTTESNEDDPLWPSAVRDNSLSQDEMTGADDADAEDKPLSRQAQETWRMSL
jgi:hypothetical protein